MDKLINIENKEGNLIVSSREIAKNFGKEHHHVVDAIENKIKNLTHEKSEVENLTTGKSEVKISDLFIKDEYEHKGNIYKEYLLTRDGFSFMVMGFTGTKADIWKLKYIEAFNKMESALKEVYHISETAIVNNVMNVLEEKIFTNIDERLSRYEENYRPTHANKINLNSYIKRGLGDFVESEEVNLVKDRVLLVLNAEAWQDIPYEKLRKSMHVVDESIRAVKSFRSKSQLSLFEN